jgi:glycosyltransferase involved in cell wall biosynthesis
VDVSWWEAYRGKTPWAYRDISRPRIVYTGVFQEKIDVPLLIALSGRRPEWRFVFVGPVQPKNLDLQLIETLKKQPNTHFWGQRDVNEIPGFLAGADLLMLPYTANENTRTAGLALKFYEYLISGKPVVTTPFTELEVEQTGLFDIAETADEWCAVMDRCRAQNDEVTARRRVELAKKNTYEARLELQRRLLEEMG